MGYHNSMSSGFQSIDSSDFTGFHSTYLWSKRLSRQQWHSKFTVETLDIYGIKMYWRWCRISSINSISAFWERSEPPPTPPPKSNLTMETPPCMKLYCLLHMDIFQCHVSFQGFKLKRTPFPIIFEWRLSQKDRIQVTVAVPKSILQLFPQWYFSSWWLWCFFPSIKQSNLGKYIPSTFLVGGLWICFLLVGWTTHLKNMRPSKWDHFPNFRGEKKRHHHQVLEGLFIFHWLSFSRRFLFC